MTPMTPMPAASLNLAAPLPAGSVAPAPAGRIVADLIALALNGSDQLDRARAAASIGERRSHLVRALTPGAAADIGAIVARLLTVFPRRKVDAGDQRSIVATYVAVLEDLPLWAVEASMRAILRGRAGLDSDWAPTAARWHQTADELVQPWRLELARADRALTALAKAERPAPIRAERVDEILAAAGFGSTGASPAETAARARRRAALASESDTWARRAFEAAGEEYQPGAASPALRAVLERRRG